MDTLNCYVFIISFKVENVNYWVNAICKSIAFITNKKNLTFALKLKVV